MKGVRGLCGAGLNRTCRPRPNGQGRPLGLIGAWLLVLGDPGHSAAEHGQARPSFAERVEARARLSALEGVDAWLAAERVIDPAIDDVGSGEPRRIP